MNEVASDAAKLRSALLELRGERQRAQFDAALLNGYFELRRAGGRSTLLFNAYWYWCCLRRLPFVWIAAKGKRWRVHLDMLPTHRTLDPDAVRALVALAWPDKPLRVEPPPLCLFDFDTPAGEAPQAAERVLQIAVGAP